ncbi:MAG: VanZ family protein [Ruminococcus sp.]|nr:VanZ family protein [Ruminococcus sp.]
MYQKICDNRKTLVNCAFLLYILGVLCVTFIVRETMVLRTPENRGVVLQPFREFDAMVNGRHFFWFKQIFLNVLLFVPFGSLLPCVNRLFRNPLIAVTAGCIFSGFIEIMQYITGRGLTEVDDVITNTIGTAVGVAIYWIAVCFKCRSTEYSGNI